MNTLVLLLLPYCVAKEFPLTSRCYKAHRQTLRGGNNSEQFGWPFDSDGKSCGFFDEAGEPLKPAACVQEHGLHRFVASHVRRGDAVLELGARYGTTTCAAARRARTVASLEPDAAVLAALRGNLRRRGCGATVYEGVLSRERGWRLAGRGYGAHLVAGGDDGAPVASHAVETLEAAHGGRFDVVIVDCEACVAGISDEFAGLLDRARVVLLELDGDHGDPLLARLEARHGLVAVEVVSGPRRVATAALVRGGRRCAPRDAGGCACALRAATRASRCGFPCLCGPPCGA